MRHLWQYAILLGHYGGHSFYVLNLSYLLKCQLLGLTPELWSKLPNCQHCQLLMSQDMKDSEDSLSSLGGQVGSCR